jgi:hypothetical protein
MAKLILWYSIKNGGDGSSYPSFFESERLTEMDQELMEEGWGECCNGFITIEGDNMSCDEVITKKSFIKYLDDIIKDRWSGVHTKRKAQEFKNELEPKKPKPFNENDPFGEEIVEIKKFQDI